MLLRCLLAILLTAPLAAPEARGADPVPVDAPRAHADRSKSTKPSGKTSKKPSGKPAPSKKKTRDDTEQEDQDSRAIPESRRQPTRPEPPRPTPKVDRGSTPAPSRESKVDRASRADPRSGGPAGSPPRSERAVAKPPPSEPSLPRARVPATGDVARRPDVERSSSGVRGEALLRSSDHRYARPRAPRVRPHALAPRPVVRWYRPWYTHWWVHPWYRWVHATTLVRSVNYSVWVEGWAPPPRAGWEWVPGGVVQGQWWPGYWRPVSPAPIYGPATYVWVPGFWDYGVWFEGYWRIASRPGWVWIDGVYLASRHHLRGYWLPTSDAPEGYVWEPGFWDGEDWVGGFWRPESRVGYRWVSSAFDEQGLFHAGYWEPLQDEPGMVWVPGWFDGTSWQEGYWVPQAEYEAADPAGWQPDEGWDDGWRDADDGVPDPGDPPLALPAGGG